MIYYEKYGNELNPIIMFLHGESAVQCFSKQCDYLSGSYCAVVPHLPGFGRNSDTGFTTGEALKQIAELAAYLGKPVTLAGFCIGATLCLPLLCRYGEYFNGAVMISPWVLKEVADVEKALKQQGDREKHMGNKLLMGINGLSMGFDRNERKTYEEYRKNMNMNSVVAAIDNGIRLEDYPEYAELDKPILALCGLKEEIGVRKSVRALYAQNPNCSYDMWDGAAQNIPFKYSARLSKTIEEFLGKIYS